MQEEIDILQQKIAALENDLSSNHKTINQLRSAVKSLSNGIIPDLPKLEEVEPPKKEEIIVKKPEEIHQPVLMDSKDVKPGWKTMPAVTVAKAEIFTEECTFGAAPNGNTADVQV